MTLVWVSSTFPRPPASVSSCHHSCHVYLTTRRQEASCYHRYREWRWEYRQPVRKISSLILPVMNVSFRMGSYTWKAEWGPDYHQSMIISFVALVISTILSLSKIWIWARNRCLISSVVVLRQWVIRDNKKLDEDEKRGLNDANRARVEEAARLEGITFDQAMQRRKGFRYLYWIHTHLSTARSFVQV